MICFGKKIAILREEIGLSQSELATKLETSGNVAFKDDDKEKICFPLDALILEVTNRKRYAHK